MKQAWMGVKQYLDEKLIRAQGKRKWELFEKLQEIVSFKKMDTEEDGSRYS